MKKNKLLKLDLKKDVVSKLQADSIFGGNGGRCQTNGPEQSCVPPPHTRTDLVTCYTCPTRATVCWDCLSTPKQ